jgi:hypothetical protein
MIKNPHILEAFERELLAKEPVNFLKNLRLVDGLLKQARSLGVFPPANPLEGIEVDIRVAGVLNRVRSAN